MTHFYNLDTPSLDDFRTLCERDVDAEAYPLSAEITKNVVIYSGKTVRGMIGDAEQEAALMAEWTRCLKDGPGVFVVKGAYADTSVIDRTTEIFVEIVAAEKAAGSGEGDHFGTNERIWNSVQKACVRDPETFVAYYGNPILGLACKAWLGPHYQMTAQMNNVKPGGKAQSAHRDYHLGFQSRHTIVQFPAHMQIASQYLTLQGAISHCDMPLEKGPTIFLPFSQQYEPGYLAFRRPEFVAYFDEHSVQVPFGKGDMVFFSPALFHAGGNNRAETDRIANLVQVSSAFGRTMETVNHRKMIEAVYPTLQQMHKNGNAHRTIREVIATVADGYSFPTNLDSDPPIGGNAPETQQAMVLRALDEGWAFEQLSDVLDQYEARRAA